MGYMWLDPDIVNETHFIFTFPESAAAVYNLALSREHSTTMWGIEDILIKCNGFLIQRTNLFILCEHHIAENDILIIPTWTDVNPPKTALPVAQSEDLQDITATVEVKFVEKPTYTFCLGFQTI